MAQKTASITEHAVAIDPGGDLNLEVHHEARDTILRYRVSSAKLRSASMYFENLLDPTKFSEGAHVAAKLNGLKSRLASHGEDVAEGELPVVRILEVPNPGSSSLEDVVRVFLEIVHEDPGAREVSLRKASMGCIARLAIVADRFLAKECLRDSIDTYHKAQQLSNEANRLAFTPANEKFWRQRLLVGIWYDYSNWVFAYSRLLIHNGSEQWRRLEEGTEEDEEVCVSSAIWNFLPGGIEEELVHRRTCVLSTIASLQNHFTAKYLSGKRICRLGYDSSAQCDSFQLGEMVRFFNRKEILTLKSSIDGQDYMAGYSGNLLALLKSLRQCPSYQIDAHHAHCGIRTLLVPRVEYLESWVADTLHIGICIKCWQRDKSGHKWLDHPAKGVWQYHRRPYGTPHCERQHKLVRAIFTSEMRDWAPEGS